MLDICELLNIEVSPARRALLSSLSLKELDQLRLRLLRDRAWPIEP